jgi:digeranylgeranylglycerophospholipid reductase
LSDPTPVVVVGASSAGLLSASLLAERGVPVAVYDQAQRTAPPRRTLIVTPDLTRALGFTPTSAIVNQVPRFEFRSNGTLASLQLQQPDLIVERAELVRLLAARAEQAGVRFERGYRFERFEPASDGAAQVVFQRNGTDRRERVPARFVVGADGARSAVARALGQPARPTTTVIQAKVSLPSGTDSGLAKVWFVPRETPYFYWLVPESPELAAVGLVAADPRAARPKLEAFLARQGYEPLEYQAARIPMYQPRPEPFGRIGGTRVFLVGDAAGQVKVTTVGGTVSGFHGARAAARAILAEGGFRRALLPVQRELALHWLIRGIWNRFEEEDYTALLKAMQTRLRAVLEARNRDRWAGAVLPFVSAHPNLLALVARVAVRGA